MSIVKEKMKRAIEKFPEDATYEEIMRELVFERMVDRGLKDMREGRVVANEVMKKHISTWQK
jgi:predicted transcriptional regulator